MTGSSSSSEVSAMLDRAGRAGCVYGIAATPRKGGAAVHFSVRCGWISDGDAPEFGTTRQTDARRVYRHPDDAETEAALASRSAETFGLRDVRVVPVDGRGRLYGPPCSLALLRAILVDEPPGGAAVSCLRDDALEIRPATRGEACIRRWARAGLRFRNGILAIDDLPKFGGGPPSEGLDDYDEFVASWDTESVLVSGVCEALPGGGWGSGWRIVPRKDWEARAAELA